MTSTNKGIFHILREKMFNNWNKSHEKILQIILCVSSFILFTGIIILIDIIFFNYKLLPSISSIFKPYLFAFFIFVFFAAITFGYCLGLRRRYQHKAFSSKIFFTQQKNAYMLLFVCSMVIIFFIVIAFPNYDINNWLNIIIQIMISITATVIIFVAYANKQPLSITEDVLEETLTSLKERFSDRLPFDIFEGSERPSKGFEEHLQERLKNTNKLWHEGITGLRTISFLDKVQEREHLMSPFCLRLIISNPKKEAEFENESSIREIEILLSFYQLYRLKERLQEKVKIEIYLRNIPIFFYSHIIENGGLYFSPHGHSADDKYPKTYYYLQDSDFYKSFIRNFNRRWNYLKDRHPESYIEITQNWDDFKKNINDFNLNSSFIKYINTIKVLSKYKNLYSSLEKIHKDLIQEPEKIDELWNDESNYQIYLQILETIYNNKIEQWEKEAIMQ